MMKMKSLSYFYPLPFSLLRVSVAKAIESKLVLHQSAGGGDSDA